MTMDVVNLASDDELEELGVKLELNMVGSNTQLTKRKASTKQGNEKNRSLNASNHGHGGSSMLDQGLFPSDETNVKLTSSIAPPPICRQFWKAGDYDDTRGAQIKPQNVKNYLQVHPTFLHSNATSHKWAFGAIAELLDNAVDEIQNGATFVAIDRITNPRDGSSALLFLDDGGGMSPEAMRRCMSFGYTHKSAKTAIGRYGNGFKTSTMRLGADVIVFSRHCDGRVSTQSIGLLSYTFLRKGGYDRIVVPMVNYEVNVITGELKSLHGKEHGMSNLSKILDWSPYSTESELLKQFDEIRPHGTKVIIYNLWLGNDGVEEFDYDTDPKDIRITGDTKKIEARPADREMHEQHIGNTFHHSLRVYLSILYLKEPANFRIFLRGELVEHHNIADDLKYIEYILYKPQAGGGVEINLATTIGFLKEAPRVNIHGFNVYHKNRLILPFWQVVSYLDNRGRGVVGVLEANFVQPTHNKQDFEKTSLFQKLETRLKEMTWEYWDYHCELVGYQAKRRVKPKVQMYPKVPPVPLASVSSPFGPTKVAKGFERQLSNDRSSDQQGLPLKRKEYRSLADTENVKRHSIGGKSATGSGQQTMVEPASSTRNVANMAKDQEAITLVEQNLKLRAKCLEHDKVEEELNLKVKQLVNEINQFESEYSRLFNELRGIEATKVEKGV